MMAAALRHFFLALQFFTRIPLGDKLAAWVGYSPALLRASAAYFPAVGLLVGAFAAAVFYCCSLALGPQSSAYLLAAISSTIASVWLTSAFHEDGLADSADALGGAVSAERALTIMKDSRIGSYGAVALILTLACKIALLAHIAQAQLLLACAALLFAHTLSRLLPLLILASLPHVGDSAQSKSKPLADSVSKTSMAIALLSTGSVAALIALWQPFYFWAYAVLASLAAFLWMRRLLKIRISGFTGDGLGATQQLGELAIYWAIALCLPELQG